MASQGESDVSLIYGQVTHIVDPSDFYLRMGLKTDLANFNEFEQRLNPLFRGLPVGRTDEVIEGCMVLACCGQQDSKKTSQWRRATVMRVDRMRNVFDVFYMDYGNTEILPAAAICSIVSDDIMEQPVMCYKCALAGIKPIAKSWTGRGIKTFEKLVSKKTLQVVLFSYDRFIIRVALYNSTGNGRSVTSNMLDAETGLPNEEHVEEFSKDAHSVSFEEFFGYGQFEEVSAGDVSESTLEMTYVAQAGGNLQQQWTELSALNPSAAGPDNTVGGDPVSMTDPYQHTNTHFANEMHSKNTATGLTLKVDSRSASVENTISSDDDKISPDMVVVPGFNLAKLQRRPMLNAEELQKEKELSMRAERKARLQKDIIDCHRALDEINLNVGEGQKWGQSDLLIGRQISDGPEVESFISGETEVEQCISDKTDVDTFSSATDMFSIHHPEERKENVEEYAAISVQHDDQIPEGHETKDDITHDIGKHGITQAIKSVRDIAHTIKTVPTEEVSSGKHSLQGKGSVAVEDKYSICLGITHAIRTVENEEINPRMCSTQAEGNVTLSVDNSSSSSVKKRGLLSLPSPQRKLTLEEEEYEKQKQFKEITDPTVLFSPGKRSKEKYCPPHSLKMILLQAAHGEDLEMVCAQLHSLVPPKPFDPCDNEPKLLMQVLFEEAIMHKEVSNLALEIISTYSGVLRGTDLLDLLKHNCDRFVKMPVAKMPKHHTDFAAVVAKLLYLSFDWPPVLQTVVQDFALGCLEKWVIFNKKGNQTGLIQRTLEEMYLECVQVILPYSISVLQEADPERYQFIFDEMRQKTLEVKVDYNLRSRLLNLLIQIGEPSVDTIAPEGHVMSSESENHMMKDLGAFRDSSSKLPSSSQSPYFQESSSKAKSPQTVDSSSQTETLDVREEEEDAGVRVDVAVQTDCIGDLPVLSRKTSISSLDSVERGDSVGSGRARRRRAVIEHLQQKKEGSSSNSSTVCLLSATAEVLSQQLCQSAKHHASSIETETEVDPKKSISVDSAGTSGCKQDKTKLQNSSKKTHDVLETLQGDGVKGPASPVQLAKSEFSADNLEKSDHLSDKQSVTATAGIEGEIPETQISLSQDMSQKSFFFAVSSASRTAWQSLFGSKGDEDCSVKLEDDAADSNLNYRVRTQQETSYIDDSTCMLNAKEDNSDLLSSSNTNVKRDASSHPSFNSNSNCHASNVKESLEMSGDDETALRLGQDNATDSVHLAETGTDCKPKTIPTAERDEDEVEELKGQGRDELKEPCEGEKSTKDFPPLICQTSASSERSATPPPLTQLSLQTIAANLLKDPEMKPVSQKEKGSKSGAEYNLGQFKFGKSAEKAAASSFVDVNDDYISKKGDDESIPSDWEEREMSQTKAPGGARKVAPDDNYREKYCYDNAPYGPFQFWLGSGDGPTESHASRPPFLNECGDGIFSEILLHSQESLLSGGISDKGDLHKLQTHKAEETELLRRSNFTPSKEGQLSDMSQQSTPSPERTESNECKTPTGKKKKKTTFRPFHPTAPLPSNNTEQRAPWQPKKFMCTNCKAEGHTRSECPYPVRDLLD